jgi:two-component system, NtrC family, nitrogen regulation response regulator NtrX
METGTTKTVLIVEDDIALRKVLIEKLTDEGFTIIEAADGETGLTQATEHHPGLILLDIFMPRMDGITMLTKLRSADPWGKNVHVIVLTNSTDAQTIATVSGLGATDFLIKSEWSLEALVARIRERMGDPVAVAVA